MNSKVYRFSPKGLRRTSARENDRLIFLGGGVAAYFEADTGILIDPNLPYKGPDSHVEKTNEAVPEMLYVSSDIKNVIDLYEIDLPFRIEQLARDKEILHAYESYPEDVSREVFLEGVLIRKDYAALEIIRERHPEAVARAEKEYSGE